MTVKRLEIYFADLGKAKGSVQAGVRPILILQNNVGNTFSTTTICAAITSKKKNHLPTHLILDDGTLKTESVIMFEQIMVLNKSQLKEKVGELAEDYIDAVNEKIAVSLGLMPICA